MDNEVITILTQAGSAGIVGLMFLGYFYFDSKKNKKKESGIKREDSQQDITLAVLKTIIDNHIKSNEESFAVIHNGLNTNNGKMSDYNTRLNELDKTVMRLITIIEERIPKNN